MIDEGCGGQSPRSVTQSRCRDKFKHFHDQYNSQFQQESLYRVNISTGATSLISSTVGNGQGYINAMGYSEGDNYLYAAVGSEAPQKLIRIAANGATTDLESLNQTVYLNAGDIDENFYYWSSSVGAQWIKVDLRPGSTTFGKEVASGTAKPQYQIFDWAYVPGAGDYLWGLGYDQTTNLAQGLTYLMRFDMTTHTWTTETNFGSIASSQSTPAAANTWGAIYASDGGFIYGSENTSGEIYRFPLPGSGTAAVKIANGPKSTQNDGARCHKASGL
ncbi:hypothetical protein LQW54_012176 [Pestalotiopsis sp. IQ-011]